MDDFKPVTDWEYLHLMEILNKNSNKTFVQRITNPDRFPTLDNGEGGYSTHKMAWTQSPDGSKFFAFPTVLYDGKSLKDYGDSAWPQAQKSGNFIEFDNPDEAAWFAQRYKGAWAGQKNKPPR